MHFTQTYVFRYIENIHETTLRLIFAFKIKRLDRSAMSCGGSGGRKKFFRRIFAARAVKNKFCGKNSNRLSKPLVIFAQKCYYKNALFVSLKQKRRIAGIRRKVFVRSDAI